MTLKIIALISSFEEHPDMLDSCIESCRDLDEIFVVDGPTTFPLNKFDGAWDAFRTPRNKVRYMRATGVWKSDADKRTDILREAKAWNHDAWGLWIDADEILLYGQYLRDHCNRADEETATGGSTIRIVEYDGSVAQCYGKLIRLGSVRRYILSSYEIELENRMTVALPNVPICSAGGIPIGEIEGRDDPQLALKRPPVIGEPHLLHRHGLRNPSRTAPRLHETEADDFENLVKGGYQ